MSCLGRLTSAFFAALACAALPCAAIASPAARAEGATHGGGFAVAQNFRAPPADVGDDGFGQTQQDSPSLPVRIDRLESQIRQMNGAIEQLQFQNRRLEDQLKKFQEDVDFRFQDNGRAGAPPAAAARPQKRSEAIDPAAPEDQPAGAGPAAGGTNGPQRAQKRADAFDPDSDLNAPGAPRPLGSAAPSAPLSAKGRPGADADPVSSDAPLDLSGAKWRPGHDAEASPRGAPATGTPGNSPLAALTTPNAAAPGSAPINPVKEEFDVAYGYYRQKEYETAEKSFAAFIQKNPKSRMMADATYYLGESFFQRNRPREAAEQYLKISTQYASSPRAADAMLRLGQSLSALGAKEQACATFAEIPRKYPNAPANVKAGAEREAKRVQC